MTGDGGRLTYLRGPRQSGVWCERRYERRLPASAIVELMQSGEGRSPGFAPVTRLRYALLDLGPHYELARTHEQIALPYFHS